MTEESFTEQMLRRLEQVKRHRNTSVYAPDDETVVVVLYDTPIMTFQLPHHCYLRAGKCRTATTKRSMNEVLDAVDGWINVYQKAGEWLVRNNYTGEEIPFFDGIDISELDER